MRTRFWVSLVVLGIGAWWSRAAPAPAPRAGGKRVGPVEFEVVRTESGPGGGKGTSPDGKRAVKLLGPLEAQVVDVTTGRGVGPVLKHTGTREGMGINTWAFSPDGKLLAVGFGEKADPNDTAGGVCVWEVATGKCLGSPGEDLGWVHGVSFSADGKRVSVRCRDISGK